MPKKLKSLESFFLEVEKAEKNLPLIFDSVAKKAGNKFVNEAKKIAKEEKLVDTGNYRRNWNFAVGYPTKKHYVIKCFNPIEYAIHLEHGHKLRNGKKWKGRFVGKRAKEKAEEFAIVEMNKGIKRMFKE